MDVSFAARTETKPITKKVNIFGESGRYYEHVTIFFVCHIYEAWEFAVLEFDVIYSYP